MSPPGFGSRVASQEELRKCNTEQAINDIIELLLGRFRVINVLAPSAMKDPNRHALTRV